MDEVPIIVVQGDMTATAPVTSEQNLAGRARCPRCGYDLRGTIGTWADQCPLHGTCTECGLQFVWAEVLHPEKFEPQWCIEYAPGRLGVLTGVIKTLGRSLWPWRFFSSLKMSHTVRPRRLALYLVFLLLMPGIAYVAEQTTVAVRVRYELTRPSLGITSINHSYFAAVIEAVFKPTSSNSSGSYAVGTFVMPYPPPNGLHEAFEIIGAGGPRPYMNAFVLSIDPTFAAWSLGVVISLLLPVGFVLLPISRRRATVRWIHVGRVTAYGFIIPSLLASAFFVCAVIAYLRLEWRNNAMAMAMWMNFLLPAPLLTIWWAAAIKRYLRMPHAWPVSILLALIALLFLAVMMMLLASLMR